MKKTRKICNVIADITTFLLFAIYGIHGLASDLAALTGSPIAYPGTVGALSGLSVMLLWDTFGREGYDE